MLQWAGIVPSLVPTRLTIAGNEVPAPTYPKPVVKALRISDTPLALYEGVVDLAAKVPPNDGAERAPVERLQAPFRFFVCNVSGGIVTFPARG